MVAEALDRAALAGLAVEALLDLGGVESHDLLDRDRGLVGANRLPEAGRFQQPLAEPDAFADDHDVGEEVVVSSGRHADHLPVADDEFLDHGLVDQEGPGLLGL